MQAEITKKLVRYIIHACDPQDFTGAVVLVSRKFPRSSPDLIWEVVTAVYDAQGWRKATYYSKPARKLSLAAQQLRYERMQTEWEWKMDRLAELSEDKPN